MNEIKCKILLQLTIVKFDPGIALASQFDITLLNNNRYYHTRFVIAHKRITNHMLFNRLSVFVGWNSIIV